MIIELATLVSVLGIFLALLIAAIGASVAYGKLSQRVTHLEAGQKELKQEIADVKVELKADIADLRTEMREGFAAIHTELARINASLENTNRILIGLANHRHDTDGNTVFTIPQAPPA